MNYDIKEREREVKKKAAHRPALVTIISVPSWSNCRQSVRPSSCTETAAILRASAASCGSSVTVGGAAAASVSDSAPADAPSSASSSASASECPPPARTSASSGATFRRVPPLVLAAAEEADAVAEADADADAVAEAEAEAECDGDPVCDDAEEVLALRSDEPLAALQLLRAAALFAGLEVALGPFEELLLELIALAGARPAEQCSARWSDWCQRLMFLENHKSVCAYPKVTKSLEQKVNSCTSHRNKYCTFMKITIIHEVTY